MSQCAENVNDDAMLADEIRAAVGEFNRLAELAVRKGLRVEIHALPLHVTGARHCSPVLCVSIAKEV